MATLTIPCPKCNGTGRITDPTAIGKKMREGREKAGVSLRSFAEIMKYSAPYISDLELGRRSWGRKIQKRYEDALKLIAK